MTYLSLKRIKTVLGLLIIFIVLHDHAVRGQEEAKKSIATVLYETIVNDGIDAAVAQYHKLDSKSYNFTETELNTLGYRLVNAGRVKDAIEIFRLNCTVYPSAFNTWDSMGEACMIDGQMEKAVANYRRSVELNPDNVNGRDMLYLLEHYEKKQYSIPMRDGIHLATIVYTPRDQSGHYPMLMNRTPYGIHPYGEKRYRVSLGPSREILEEGYIFVYQDVRGRYMSEGEFENMRAVLNDPARIDESTDTYDTVEWLLKNISGHNGRIGMWGISYPGFYSLMGGISNHPALVAVSPQAPPVDWFRGDDFHRNGAFYLLQAVNFFRTVGVARPRPTEDRAERILTYTSPDLYSYFRRVGPLKNWNDSFFHHRIAYWDTLMRHGQYDTYWKDRNVLPHLKKIHSAVLMVGGWYDAEDLYGPLAAYQAVEKNNPSLFNTLVMGPWYHGGWARGDGDRLGEVRVESTDAAAYYRSHIELPFFNYHLKGKGTLHLPEAFIYDTGRLQWLSLDRWPPKEAHKTQFFFGKSESLDREISERTGQDAFDAFISDPAKPVPHSCRIENSWNYSHMISDQRFAAWRPDVLVYQTEPLEHDITAAGPVEVTLYVSTTGTDADWFVKLIDVYPEGEDDYTGIPYTMHMGEYQALVRLGVMRGKFRNSLEKPEPFVSNRVTKVSYTLDDVCYTFRKGHRLMVHVQSTCFPLFDINPQTFVDIYSAGVEDFQKATHRVYTCERYPSHITLGILKPE
jgi:putative CocE/NonD family hydrolase